MEKLGFDKSHIFRKVPGRMKNEVSNGMILEFAALQCKCYSYIIMLKDGSIIICSRHKGIKSYMIKRLFFENFKRKVLNGADINLTTLKVDPSSAERIANSPLPS